MKTIRRRIARARRARRNTKTLVKQNDSFVVSKYDMMGLLRVREEFGDKTTAILFHDDL